MSEIRTFFRPKQGCLREVADKIKADGRECLVPPEVVFEQDEKLGTGEVLFMVLERYYMRNRSYAALSIQLTDDGATQKATVVASGGGEGLFNFSWGANGNFAALVAESLTQIDFVEELAP